MRAPSSAHLTSSGSRTGTRRRPRSARRARCRSTCTTPRSRGPSPGRWRATSIRSPGCRSRIACAVLAIGSGQDSPFRSSVVGRSVCAHRVDLLRRPVETARARGCRPCGTVSQYRRLNIHFADVPGAVRLRRHRRVLVVEPQRRRLAVAGLEEAHHAAAVVRPSARCRGRARRSGSRSTGASKCAVEPRFEIGRFGGVAEREDPLVVPRPAACACRWAASRPRRRGRSRSRPARPRAAAPAPAGRTRPSRPRATSTVPARRIDRLDVEERRRARSRARP